jgi:hypothetical protein
MKGWHRLVLAGAYCAAAIWIYLARDALPAHSGWVSVGLIGLACWEFEPILRWLLNGAGVKK